MTSHLLFCSQITFSVTTVGGDLIRLRLSGTYHSAERRVSASVERRVNPDTAKQPRSKLNVHRYYTCVLLSFEWNAIRLCGPAHGIVTKTVHKTLPGSGGGQGGRGVVG